MWIRISLTIAACFIVAGFGLGWCDRDLGDVTIRQHLRAMKQQGTPPAPFQNVDLDTVDLSQYDTTLPSSLQFRDALSRFLLQRFWPRVGS